jgi:hypothetical protein
VQKALPLIQEGGSIILNASINASKGLETSSVYSATKAAIRSCVAVASSVSRPRWVKDQSRSHLFIKYSRNREQIYLTEISLHCPYSAQHVVLTLHAKVLPRFFSYFVLQA